MRNLTFKNHSGKHAALKNLKQEFLQQVETILPEIQLRFLGETLEENKDFSALEGWEKIERFLRGMGV